MKTLLLLLICFSFCACEEKEIDVDLTDSTWKVISIKQSGLGLSEKAQETYTLMFKGNKTYVLTLDVNNCQGVYNIHNPGEIVLERSGCTKVCCDSDFAETLLELIPNMTEYFMRGDILIFSGNGQIELIQL